MIIYNLTGSKNETDPELREYLKDLFTDVIVSDVRCVRRPGDEIRMYEHIGLFPQPLRVTFLSENWEKQMLKNADKLKKAGISIEWEWKVPPPVETETQSSPLTQSTHIVTPTEPYHFDIEKHREPEWFRWTEDPGQFLHDQFLRSNLKPSIKIPEAGTYFQTQWLKWTSPTHSGKKTQSETWITYSNQGSDPKQLDDVIKNRFNYDYDNDDDEHD